ncbi:MAG: inositol monophosphatase [Patescibacteria group bacterium]
MKKTAIQAAKLAGDYLAQNFAKIRRSQISVKSASQVVSRADTDAEKIILKTIRRKFPDHSIYSEEIGHIKKKSDYQWVIDPLDGSTNFLMQNPFFATSIALLHKGRVILGVANAPLMNHFYLAEKNKGAYRNGKKIRVSNKKKLSESFLTFCHGNSVKDIKRSIKVYQTFKLLCADMRQLGSGILECGMVAFGSTEDIMTPGANLYDVAAGALMVEEAGGRVTDFQGDKWSVKSKDIVCSNSHIHNQLIKHLKKI